METLLEFTNIFIGMQDFRILKSYLRTEIGKS